MRRWYIWCVVMLLIAGCGSSGLGGSNGLSPTPTTSGSTTSSSLALRVQLPARVARTTSAPTVPSGSVTIQVLGSSGQVLGSTSVTLASGGTTSASFTNLPTGPVSVQVQLFTASQALVASGSGSTTIVPGPNSLSIQLALQKLWVYATNTVDQTVATFQFDPAAGTLTAVGTPVSVPGAETLVADRSGQFLYVADFTNNELHVLSINQASGALTLRPQLTVGIPGSIQPFPVVTADNRFLYVSVENNTQAVSNNPEGLYNALPQGAQAVGMVAGFARNPVSGALTPVPGGPYTTVGFDAAHPILDPNGKFLYVASTRVHQIPQSNASSVQQICTTLSIGNDGSLQRVGTTVLPDLLPPATNLASAVAEWFSPIFNPASGDGLLQSVGLNGLPTAFTALTGSPLNTVVSGSPASGSGFTTGSTFDSTGQFLYSLDISTNAVDLYDMGSNGLPQPSQASFSTDQAPNYITFDPTGEFALVACKGPSPGFAGMLDLFSENPTTGALTEVATIASGSRTDEAIFVPVGPAPAAPPVATPTPTLPTGTLTYLGSSPGQQDVVVTPNDKFLYVSQNDSLLGFAINSDGTLNLTPVAAISGSNLVYGLAVDPQGQFLYSSDLVDLHAYSIGSNGSLTEIQGSPVADGGAGLIATDPTGTFVYATNALQPIGPMYFNLVPTSSYLAFQLDRSTPSLSTLAPVAAQNLLQLAVSSADSLLAGTPYNSSSPLQIYSLSSPSAPTGVFSTNEFFLAGGLGFTPNGQFLYVTQDDSDAVTGYQVASNGSLTALSQGNVATGTTPEWLAIDPTGRFMAVTNNADTTVDIFTIASDGTLTAASGSPFTTSGIPGFCVFDSTGTHLYVGCAGGMVTNVFSVAP